MTDVCFLGAERTVDRVSRRAAEFSANARMDAQREQHRFILRPVAWRTAWAVNGFDLKD